MSTTITRVVAKKHLLEAIAGLLDADIEGDENFKEVRESHDPVDVLAAFFEVREEIYLLLGELP